MAEHDPKQLLHLVFGGELVSTQGITFRDLAGLDIVGIFPDYESALAAQRSWPSPVWEQKAQTDAQFEKLAGLMLRHRDVIDGAFGTHNARSIAACLAWAEAMEVPPAALEFQML